MKLPKQREEVKIIARQFLRAATSVAAHIREASRDRSADEFVSKLGGALQEADETQFWLELLREDCAARSESLDMLHREAKELIAIFVTMIKASKHS